MRRGKDFGVRLEAKLAFKSLDGKHLLSLSWWAEQTGVTKGAISSWRKDPGGWLPAYENALAIFYTADGLKTGRIPLPDQCPTPRMPTTASSGYRGVYWYADAGLWMARIVHRHLGYFPTREMAALEYNIHAKKLWGEYAILNEVTVQARLCQKCKKVSPFTCDIERATNAPLDHKHRWVPPRKICKSCLKTGWGLKHKRCWKYKVQRVGADCTEYSPF